MTAHRRESAPIFSPLIIAACFFVLAFALRIVFAIEWQDMPYGNAPLLDAQGYDSMAWSIANGQGAGNDAFYQSPLYPYLLSVLYRVVGHNYFAASLLNDVLDSGTVALLCVITHSLFGRMAAVIAGLLAAGFAPMIFFTAPIMKEPLELFLFALFLFFALRAVDGNRRKDYAACGIVFGLAVLARGNALLLAPVIPVFAFMRDRHAAWHGVLLFAVAAILAIAPVTWRNYQIAHDFVPITYDEGFNLYIGHSRYANGTNAYPPEISTSPAQEKLAVILAAERETGRKLKPSEVSLYWRGKAVDFALTHPWRELQLLALKLFAFWNDADDVDNYDTRFIKQNFPSLLNMPLANFWLVSALAAFTVCGGGWRLCKTKRAYALLLSCVTLYMISLLIFYVTDRYRLPVALFLIPLAGAALPSAILWIKQKQARNIITASCGSALFLCVGLHASLNPVDLRAFDWGVLTAIYADKGDADKTFDAFHKGVEISPTGIGSQAYIHVAQTYERLGQMNVATQLVQRAVEIYPQDGVALYNLGRMQALQGHLDAALQTLQKAQTLSPDYGLIYFALAEIYQKKGDLPHAHQALQNGLFADPEEPHLVALKEQND